MAKRQLEYTQTSTTFIAGNKLKALLRFTPDTDVRYYLNGIFFDHSGYAVATDGKRLMAVKIPVFSGPDFIVRREVIQAALKSKKGKQALGYSFGVSADTLDGVPHTPIDGKFPEWQRVAPRKLSGKPAQYDSRYVEAARHAVEDFTGRVQHSVVVIPNGSGPGVVQGSDAEVLMIIMPLRVTQTIDDVNPLLAAFFAN